MTWSLHDTGRWRRGRLLFQGVRRGRPRFLPVEGFLRDRPIREPMGRWRPRQGRRPPARNAIDEAQAMVLEAAILELEGGGSPGEEADRDPSGGCGAVDGTDPHEAVLLQLAVQESGMTRFSSQSTSLSFRSRITPRPARVRRDKKPVYRGAAAGSRKALFT